MPKAYDVEAREREERKRKAREGEEGSELDRFPVMMSFKAFLETQDDSITDEEALIKVQLLHIYSYLCKNYYILLFRNYQGYHVLVHILADF